MDEASTSKKKVGKQHNTLPVWGNEASMNLNPLILANIQGSSYFKVHLFKLKTYHEVVDEIYYQVKHLEPWERGSRKTSGQTGMCGGVRGVGAGGIVSTAYCLLFKLYTLRLTRKQVNGLLIHTDSPYIRALGFMYLRYTQPPGDLYDWYEDYLQDEEEIDVKAGGGQIMTIGQMVYQFLVKLDWFSTLFPRIPVPIQKQIESKLENYCRENRISLHQLSAARSTTSAAAGGGSSNYEAELSSERGAGSGSNRSYLDTTHSKQIQKHYRSEHDDRDYYRDDSSTSYSSRHRSHKHNSSETRGSYHRHRSRSRSTSRDRYERDSGRSRKTRDDYDNRYHR